jgi:hypothetical protein
MAKTTIEQVKKAQSEFQSAFKEARDKAAEYYQAWEVWKQKKDDQSKKAIDAAKKAAIKAIEAAKQKGLTFAKKFADFKKQSADLLKKNADARNMVKTIESSLADQAFMLRIMEDGVRAEGMPI